MGVRLAQILTMIRCLIDLFPSALVRLAMLVLVVVGSPLPDIML